MSVPKNFRLATIGGIMTELKRCYRLAHTGQMDWPDAVSASKILRELRSCLEGGSFEARLAAIEQADAKAQPPDRRRPNGHGARL